MKIVLCASDCCFPIHQAIKECGHNLIHVYTGASAESGFAVYTERFANEMGARFTRGRVEPEHIEDLSMDGVDLLISAAYDFKIPTPEASGIKFVNIHNSLLPHGRGAWPDPWFFFDHSDVAGITFHQMTQKWDYGDIILQERIHLDSSDNLDSLTGRTLVILKRLAILFLSDFERIWRNRVEMVGDGSYWPMASEEMKTLDLKGTVLKANNTYKAFMDETVLLGENGLKKRIKSLAAWKEKHSLEAGSFVTLGIDQEVYALQDGYLFVSLDKREGI